jgi:hypothetical protein
LWEKKKGAYSSPFGGLLGRFNAPAGGGLGFLFFVRVFLL